MKQVDEIAPAEATGGGDVDGGRGARGAAAAEPPPAPNLANIGAQMVAAALSMQGSEMPPTAAQIRACSQQEAAYTALMAKWAAVKGKYSIAEVRK
jgi:hypothetical protein